MMKKLLVAAALCCAAVAGRAVAAQARTWTVINAGAYDGYKITVLEFACIETEPGFMDELSLSTLNDLFLADSALGLFESETWSQHYATLSEYANISTVANGTAQDTYDIDPYLSATFLLCRDGIAPGKEYVVTKTLYDTSGNSTFDFTNAEVLSSGTFRTDSVPEPTSGLLLLLGVAGLALKRKQT